MHILMTGATGLIGRRFIANYADLHTFVVLTRDTAKAKSVLGSHIEYLESLSSLPNLNDFDAVVNLAGEPIADKRWTADQKYRICHSRWDITQSLVNLINNSDTPPALFVSGSAIGFYGRQNDQAIDETFDKPNQEFTHEICSQWETIAKRANTQVALLRTGVVLDTSGGALDKMLLPFKLGLGGRIASGDQYMSWIHIEDMIHGIQFILENNISGAVNMTAPGAVPNSAFVKALGNALGRPTLFPMPKFALQLMMGEAADLLTTGQNVVPAKLRDNGFSFRYPDIDSAFAQLISA